MDFRKQNAHSKFWSNHLPLHLLYSYTAWCQPILEKHPDRSLCKVPDFSELQAVAFWSKSCSHIEYTTSLARELFSQEERLTWNVSRKLGKGALDVNRFALIKWHCFEMFTLTNTENHHKAWYNCDKAIDMTGRSRFWKSKKLYWEYHFW